MKHSMDMTIVKQVKYALHNTTKHNSEQCRLIGDMLEKYAEENGNSCLSILAYDFQAMSKKAVMCWLIPEMKQQLDEMIKNNVPYCDECKWKLKEYPMERMWI
jgi:hypothetical protein